MSCDTDAAVRILQGGLNLEKENRFKQADSSVIFLPSNLSSEL